jgi:hypothetical protein
MDEAHRKRWIYERLEHSLQALALPATAQVSYFPDFVVKADELVLDFDHWRDCAVGNYRVEMTASQVDSLAAVEAHIDAPDCAGDGVSGKRVPCIRIRFGTSFGIWRSSR